MTQAICTGYGASDSHALVLNDGRPNPHGSAGQPYSTIDAAALWAMVQNPPTVAKELGQWIIPSAYAGYDARAHAAQRERGQYWWLAADIDKGDPDLNQVCSAVVNVMGPVCFLTYTSRSSTAFLKKWRVLIPLARPLSGDQFGPFQASWFDALETQGLILDRTLERNGQLVYLPNRGEHYEYYAHNAPLLDAHAHPMAKRAAQYLQARKEAEAATSTADRQEGARSFLRAFRVKHTIASLLAAYGYVQGSGDNWRSPYQATGGFATRDNDDHWYSLSDSDAAAGLGRAVSSGGRYGDAFDLYCHFSCQGNQELAMQYAKQCLAEEDEARYGEATAAHGATVWALIQATEQAAIQRREEETVQAAEEAQAFAEAAKEAERNRWGGEWVNQVPFHIEPNAMEWAAWHAPGVIGEAIRAKAKQSARHSLVPLLAGALAAVCYLGQGKIVLRYQKFVTPSAIMSFLVGGTGTGKGDAVEMFKGMQKMIALDNEPMVLAKVQRNFASGEAVTHFLSTVSPHVLLLQSEAGATRAATKGNGRQEHIAAELTDLFTAFTSGIEGTHAKTEGKGTDAVHNPSLSALLLSTPDKLFKTIEGADAESGWLGRYLFFPLRESPMLDETPEDVHYPPAVSVYLNRLARLTPPDRAAIDPRVYHGREHSFHVMRYSAEAEAYMKHIARSYDTRSLDHRNPKLARALYSRSLESVSRLSFVAGIACSVDERVQMKEVQWAEVVCNASLDFVVSRMAHLYEGDQDDSPLAKLRKSIKDCFRRTATDAAYSRSWGKDFKMTADGVALGRNMLKRKLKENIGRQINTGSRAINEELDEMIKDGELIDLGKEIGTTRSWLRLSSEG